MATAAVRRCPGRCVRPNTSATSPPARACATCAGGLARTASAGRCGDRAVAPSTSQRQSATASAGSNTGAADPASAAASASASGAPNFRRDQHQPRQAHGLHRPRRRTDVARMLVPTSTMWMFAATGKIRAGIPDSLIARSGTPRPPRCRVHLYFSCRRPSIAALRHAETCRQCHGSGGPRGGNVSCAACTSSTRSTWSEGTHGLRQREWTGWRKADRQGTARAHPTSPSRRRRPRHDGQGPFTWVVIDPLDGTSNYLRGFPALVRVDRPGRGRRRAARGDSTRCATSCSPPAAAARGAQRAHPRVSSAIRSGALSPASAARANARAQLDCPRTAGPRRGSAAPVFGRARPGLVACGRADGYFEAGLQPGTSPPACCWCARPAAASAIPRRRLLSPLDAKRPPDRRNVKWSGLRRPSSPAVTRRRSIDSIPAFVGQRVPESSHGEGH